MSIFGEVWTHGDLATLHDNLRGWLAQTQSQVTACGALDQATLDSWNAFATSATAYIDSSPGYFMGLGTEADAGEDIQRQIRAWQLQLEGKGCPLTGPLTPVPASDKNGESLDKLNTALKYATIIACAWGAAFLVGQITQYIPKPVGASER